MKAKFFFFYILPIIIYMGIIFYFSSQPVISIDVALKEKGFFIERWLLHIIEYAILSLLLYRALIKTKFKNYSLILAVSISTLYSLSDEIHQIFVIGRSFDVLDLIFDFTGAVLMQMLIKLREKI